MRRPSIHPKYSVRTIVFGFCIVVIPSCVLTASSTYSKPFYQHPLANTTGAGFEPRGNVGGGGSGEGYSMGGGWSNSMGVSPMASRDVYKYQIYSNPATMSGRKGLSRQGGGDDADDDFGDFPTELLGLLGLTGLKGLKGAKGALALLSGGLPLLFPILLPLLLPLLLPILLPGLVSLLLPLLLLIFIPIPVISTGRSWLETPTGKNFVQEKIYNIQPNLPEDISQIVDQIWAKSDS